MIDFFMPASYEAIIDRERLEQVAQTTVKSASKHKNTSLSLKITTNQAIRAYNRDYRGVDEATDVLSFPSGFDNPETGEYYLGDIIISLQTARKQAHQAKVEVHHEIEMLLVHGILHLCGFDHGDKNEFEAMSRLQDQILSKVNNPLLGSIHGE